MADVKTVPTLERDFSKVVLTLENVLIPDEKLSPTPSMQDGLDLETETDLRILGCELIQTSGILLKLPQVCHVLSRNRMPKVSSIIYLQENVTHLKTLRVIFLFISGGHGHRSGVIPKILLLEIIPET